MEVLAFGFHLRCIGPAVNINWSSRKVEPKGIGALQFAFQSSRSVSRRVSFDPHAKTTSDGSPKEYRCNVTEKRCNQGYPEC